MWRCMPDVESCRKRYRRNCSVCSVQWIWWPNAGRYQQHQQQQNRERTAFVRAQPRNIDATKNVKYDGARRLIGRGYSHPRLFCSTRARQSFWSVRNSVQKFRSCFAHPKSKSKWNGEIAHYLPNQRYIQGMKTFIENAHDWIAAVSSVAEGWRIDSCKTTLCNCAVMRRRGYMPT